MNAKILFVDDDAHALTGYRRVLHNRLAVETALGPELGLAAVSEKGPYAVVVADMKMPGMNGVEFLTRLEQIAPDTVRVMLTGNTDLATAIDAVNQGHVFRFLTKPCPLEILGPAIEGGIKQYRLIMAERELLEQTLNGSIKMLTDLLAMSNADIFGRAEQLRNRARQFAQHFKLAQPWELEMAAMLSSIGCVTLPSSVVMRAANGLPMNSVEKEMVSRMPQTSARLLSNIPRLETVAKIVLYQNKNFDGTGFPNDSVTGEAIPIGARILKIIIDLAAIEDQKSSLLDAFAKIKTGRGRYDPKVLESVAELLNISFSARPATLSGPTPVSLKELRVGQRLSEGVLTRDGSLIVPAATQITPLLLEKLRNFANVTGVQEPLYVES